MIVVTVELWPCGDEDSKKEIGRMYVANDGHGSSDRGDYKVAVCRRGTTEVPREIYPADYDASGQPKAARAGAVKDYPRLAYNVWRLITRAVLSAFPEEVPKGTKANGTPVLDEEVMLGIRSLATNTIDGRIVRVIEWLAAAEGDL